MNQIAPLLAEKPVATPELFLVDGSSFVFRAHFQAENQDPRYNFRASDNFPTGALRGFTQKMLQIARDGAAGITPTHIAVSFDVSRRGWRRDLYPEYKANRSDHPEHLIRQLPLMREAIRALGLTPVELEGFEADDLIATYCRLAVEAGFTVTIISADKDLMQLVSDRVRFFDFASGSPGKPGYRAERNYDPAGVTERWEGALPTMIADVQALIGDKTDNIPGVDGIGLKTAVALLEEFGSLDDLLANAAGIKQNKRRESILANIETIRLSRKLVSLDEAAPVPVGIEAFAVSAFDPTRLLAFTKAFELDGLTKQVAKAAKIDASKVAADPRFSARTSDEAPESALPSIAATVIETISTVIGLKNFLAAAGNGLAMEVLYGVDGLVGVGLCTGPGKTAYLPVGHGDPGSLFGVTDGQVDKQAALNALDEVLGNPSVRKLGFDIKGTWMDLMSEGVSVSGFDDVMLMAYAQANGLTRIELEPLSVRRLRYSLPSLADAMGSGKNKRDAAALPIPDAGAIMGARAEAVYRLAGDVEARMDEAAMRIYSEIDLPLLPVLARMEDRGISVDQVILSNLSTEFAGRMKVLESRLYGLAGSEFLVSSPKQVGEVLFDVLGLPGGKKTTSGQWETGAGTLEELAAQGHEFPRSIVDWRQVAKLKSTYTDPLCAHARVSSRVHTTFNQAATNTGRLSSNDPNLQNVPIRTEDGRKIRSAFVASPGHLLVAADYSQIELRLLAEIADIPRLKQAFADGIDIHALTASEMFGVPVAGMPPEIRRSAKAINFGIIYGISSFGLANQLGISPGEAGEYIKRYFDRFPGIRAYMETTKEFVHANGFVETLFGRRIHFPQIGRAKGPEAASIERAAINAPIQGTAADIIRRAMVRMEPALEAAGVVADMLLQVHDELVFDVPVDQGKLAMPIIKQVMETACDPDFSLSVVLDVDAKAAINWELAH